VSYNDIIRVSFGSGWIATFVIVFALNVFLLAHWVVTDFKTRRFAKALACVIVNIALAVPFFVYFVRFFGGFGFAPYMIPLSYFAGFYMCFSIYAAGVFFFTDMFRAVRARRSRARGRREGSVTVEKVNGGDGRGSAKKRRGLPRLLKPRFTMSVAIVCIALSLAAFYTPLHITTTKYDIALDRGDSDLTGVRAVFISDTHAGGGVHERELNEIVARTNEAKPDIVLLGGDIIDEGTPDYLKRAVAESFAGFKSAYGTYYIIGNHDDFRGDTAAVVSLFEDAGIHCLLDKTVLIDDGFYLIGRDDSPLRRRPFGELAAEVTKDLPVIVLDHRPHTSEIRRSGAVDLQLSGHTHDGQIVPFHWLDPLGLFVLNYGHYEKDGTQIIVSSGAGEFAVPVRLGSPAEILVIDIAFK
jgi:predicted MPP superfamily phosphohydrolase